MLTPSIKIRGGKDLERKLKAIAKNLKSDGVQAGVLAGTGQHPGSDATVAEVAVWNEFGTSRIPARPFMRATLRLKSRTYRSQIRRSLRALLWRRSSMRIEETRLGMQLQSDIRTTIDRLKHPANSSRTVARKRSTNPLIDSGFLRQAINWANFRRGALA